MGGKAEVLLGWFIGVDGFQDSFVIFESSVKDNQLYSRMSRTLGNEASLIIIVRALDWLSVYWSLLAGAF